MNKLNLFAKTLLLLFFCVNLYSSISASPTSTSKSGTCDNTNDGLFYFALDTWNAGGNYVGIRDDGHMITNGVNDVGNTFDYIFSCGQVLNASIDPGGFLVKRNSSGTITDCDIVQNTTSGTLPVLDTTFRNINTSTTGCYNGNNGGVFNYSIPLDSKYDGAQGSFVFKITESPATGNGYTSGQRPTCTRTINFTIKCPEKWVQTQGGSLYVKGDQTNPISPNLPKKAINYTIKDIKSTSYTNIRNNGVGANPATTTTTRNNCGINDQLNMFTGIQNCNLENEDFASSYFLMTGVDSTRRAKPIGVTSIATQVSKYNLFADLSELSIFEPYLTFDTQPNTLYDYYKELIKSNTKCNNYHSKVGFTIPVGSGDLWSQLASAGSLLSAKTGNNCLISTDTLDVNGNLYISSGNWNIQSNMIILVSGDLVLNGDIIKTQSDKNILFIVKGNVRIGAGNYKSNGLSVIDYPNYDRLDVNIVTDGKYISYRDDKVDTNLDPMLNNVIATTKLMYDGLQINGSLVISNMCPNQRSNPLYNSSMISNLSLGNTCVSLFGRDLFRQHNFIAPAEQFIYDSSILTSFADVLSSPSKYSIRETGYDPRQ